MVSFSREALIRDSLLFDKCLTAEGQAKQRVEADLALAKRLSIPGTPAVFIDGEQITQIDSLSFFKQLNDRLRR